MDVLKLSPRRVVQSGFLLLVLLSGVQFARYVAQFEPGGVENGISYPGSVAAFLPIGGLTTLKHWFASGEVHPFHPAALFLFVAALTVSAVAAKSFCSWICPVGFISELLYQPWFKRFRRNARLPRWLDFGLRSVKYLLLAFFVWAIGYGMSAEQTAGFLEGDYWKIADVKMLRFFTDISTTSLVVVGALVLLSLPTRNFWCRFLCPYGALLGMVGWLSPFRIRRDSALCNDCGKCTRNCPAHLEVAKSAVVLSPECSSCLTCEKGCPTKALKYGMPAFGKARQAPALDMKRLALLVLVVFFSWVVLARVTGNWSSGVSGEDRRRLLQELEAVAHPR